MFDKIQMILMMERSISNNRISRLNKQEGCLFCTLEYLQNIAALHYHQIFNTIKLISKKNILIAIFYVPNKNDYQDYFRM